MGRFGNVMLTGGESNLELSARAGEVVRFYFTNTANTRLFNVAIPGALPSKSCAPARTSPPSGHGSTCNAIEPPTRRWPSNH